MKQVSILIIFVLSTFITWNQECYVKLNLRLCQNCYVSYQVLDNLAKNFQLVFVTPNMSAKEFEFAKKELIPGVKSDYSVINSDSLYKSISRSFDSEIYLYDKDKNLIFQSSLTKFINNYDFFMNKLLRRELKITNTYTLPDSIIISPATKFINSSSSYYFIDIIYDILHIVNKKDSSIISIVPDQIDHKDIFDACFEDSTTYYLFSKIKDHLATMRNDTYSIHDAKLINDSLYLFVEIPYPVIEGEGKIGLFSAFAMLLFDGSRLVKILPIQSINDFDDQCFNSNYFYTHEDDFYLTVHRSENRGNGKMSILSKYRIENGRMNAKEILPSNLPVFYNHYKLGYNYFRPILAYPYCFFNLTNEYFNLESDSSMFLPFKNKYFERDEITNKIKSDFKCIDVINLESNFQLLTYDYKEKCYFISLIDKKTNEFSLFPQRIEYNVDREVAAGFLDENTIYFFKDKELVFIII